MATFGSISIEVGANLSKLKIGMDDSLSMIDKFGDDATRKTKSIWNKVGAGMSGIWSTIKESFKKDFVGIFDSVSDGLGNISDAIGKLNGPLGLLPKSTQNSVIAFGAFADQASDVAGGLSAVGRTAQPLLTLFPNIAKIGKRAFGALWKAITGPIGLAVAAISALGVTIYKNFDASVKIMTDFANSLIKVYNENIILRGAFEAILLPLKNMFDIGKAIINVFSIVASNVADSFKAIIKGDFSGVAKIVQNSLSKLADVGTNLGNDFANNFKESVTNVVKGRELITEEDTRGFLKPIKNMGDNISDILSRVLGDGDGNIQDALDGLSDQFTSNFKKIGEKSSKVIKKAFVEDIPKLLGGLGGATIKPLDVPVNITIPEKSKENIKEISQSIKDFSSDVGAGLSDIFTNIFDGKDTGRLKELNSELKEQRAILSDKSADKESRDAAKDRIELINQEIKAEKDKSNVVVQASTVIIDAVKKQIGAKLAEGIATLIPKVLQAIPFPLNLLAVGGAVAALKGIFSSKIPKLAQGGLLRGRTLFEGGEYPGAANNPEVVEPLNSLTDRIRKAIAPSIERRQMMPSIVGGTIDTIIRGEDIYQLVKIHHQKEKRSTGINYFE